VFGKQTAAVFMSMATATTIRGNIMYNGPRAGINFNDVLGGGHLVEHNLLFNWGRCAPREARPAGPSPGAGGLDGVEGAWKILAA
jgi:hypothetical protein